MAFIEVRNLSFAYEGQKEKKVLKDLSFDINKGSITAVIGLSGSGKSTLCMILAGVIPFMVDGYIEGKVILDGENIGERSLKEMSQKVGFVMQDPDRQIICPTVEEELAFGPENLALPREEIRQRVDSTLELLNIEDLRYRNPLDLSGGQRQTVSTAAVLTMNPQVLILDEPMSHLDKESRQIMRRTMRALKKSRKTLIVVEHDYHTMDFADRWLHIKDGKIAGYRPPSGREVDL